MRPMSENRRIARAAGLVGALTLCSRIAGLLRDVAIGYFFGTSPAADAFFVAFRIPNLLRRFVAEGAMSVAFVPVLTDYLTRGSREEAVRVARILLAALAAVLAPLTCLGIALAPLWVLLFAPGFADRPALLALTVHLTRLLFPYVFLVSLVALLGGLLNALRHFTAPALSPLVLNLAIIAAAVLLSPRLSVPVLALAYGVLAGGVLQLGLQLVPLFRRGILMWLLWNPRHPAVRRVLVLLTPSLLGAAVYQVNLMMTTVFASVLPAGSVSYLWYAGRVFEFPLGLFAVALGTAALPSFSAQASRKAYDEMRRSLQFAMGLTNFIAVPAAVGLFLLATPITAVLFERGAFGPAQAAMTAEALRMFAVGLWAVSMARVLVPAFYALGDARTPVIAAAASFAANLVFSLVLIGPLERGTAAPGPIAAAALDLLGRLTRALALADLKHSGLALATSLSALVNVLVLLPALSRRLGALGAERIAGSLARNAVAATGMGALVWFLAGATNWSRSAGTLRRGLLLAAIITAGAAVHTAIAHLLGAREPRAMASLLAKRLGAGAADRKP
jgi:putative peptidoglycan lipid II flippase